MRRRLCLALAPGSLLLPLAACDKRSADLPADEVRQRLVGTWLRQIEENGIRVRRILVLEPDGQFREMVRIVDAAGAVTEQAHAGEWLFDGTNLKRRYTLMDGKQPSAPTMPYATFQLRFPSKHEFIGTDNVRQREIRYERVPSGALP